LKKRREKSFLDEEKTQDYMVFLVDGLKRMKVGATVQGGS
jgi:hypothetical protein